FGSGAAFGSKLTKDQAKSKFITPGFSPRQSPSLLNTSEQNDDSIKNKPDSKSLNNKKQSRMNLAGRKIGKVLDAKVMVKDKVKQTKDKVTDTPTNLRYGVHKSIEKTKKAPSNFKCGLIQEKVERAEIREKQRQQRDAKMDERGKLLGEALNRHEK
ncbi:hypothetical protein, partial [Escherichia coli]|uniref:hypothetical protein n=1 Tax=Escherichia coli TaxID=562 RepID=UPI001BD1F816